MILFLYSLRRERCPLLFAAFLLMRSRDEKEYKDGDGIRNQGNSRGELPHPPEYAGKNQERKKSERDYRERPAHGLHRSVRDIPRKHACDDHTVNFRHYPEKILQQREERHLQNDICCGYSQIYASEDYRDDLLSRMHRTCDYPAGKEWKHGYYECAICRKQSFPDIAQHDARRSGKCIGRIESQYIYDNCTHYGCSKNYAGARPAVSRPAVPDYRESKVHADNDQCSQT